MRPAGTSPARSLCFALARSMLAGTNKTTWSSQRNARTCLHRGGEEAGKATIPIPYHTMVFLFFFLFGSDFVRPSHAPSRPWLVSILLNSSRTLVSDDVRGFEARVVRKEENTHEKKLS
jgi:hypothetical protein